MVLILCTQRPQKAPAVLYGSWHGSLCAASQNGPRVFDHFDRTPGRGHLLRGSLFQQKVVRSALVFVRRSVGMPLDFAFRNQCRVAVEVAYLLRSE